MIRIAIVEDDEKQITELRQYMHRYEKDTATELKVYVFHDGAEILDNYTPQYDIILMDIEMRLVDGMTAAEEIRRQDAEVTLIFITLALRSGVMRIAVSDIYYVECQGHTLYFHAAQGVFEMNGTMKSIEESLKDLQFSRGNNCYLINLVHVDGIEDKCALVKGEKLILSRPRQKAFMQDLTKYWGSVQ